MTKTWVSADGLSLHETNFITDAEKAADAAAAGGLKLALFLAVQKLKAVVA